MTEDILGDRRGELPKKNLNLLCQTTKAFQSALFHKPAKFKTKILKMNLSVIINSKQKALFNFCSKEN